MSAITRSGGSIESAVTNRWPGALARIGDEFYATQAHCLHLQGPLGHGKLDGYVLTCPWHGWQYDIRTGLNEFDHAIELETYDVRVEDGEVKIALP